MIGGRTQSLINVFDTGTLLDGSDALTINGTDYPDVFLLRSQTGDSGLAFVALINGPTPLAPAPTTTASTRSGFITQASLLD